MRQPSLVIVVVAALGAILGCGGPTGIMADTDASSSGSSGTDGTDAATNMTTTSPPTTSASTTMTTDPTTTMTTNPTTTSDPDSSTTDDPSSTTDGETGECIPGELSCPCDVGSTCDGELVCEKGVCVDVPACDEPEGEPNDDEASAVELEDVTCGQPAMMATGAFDGAETDWFVYHAQDGIACFEAPDIDVEADVDIAVCAFVSCDSGNEDVTCQGGAEDESSPDGLPGCCNQNGVELDFNCQLGAANASIFVRLVSVDAACVPYELAFDY